MDTDNTQDGAEPSPASAGSHGIPVVIPAMKPPGNFAGIKWNSCCRQHRDALDRAGIEWVEDGTPLAIPLEVTPDGRLTEEEREVIASVVFQLNYNADDLDKSGSYEFSAENRRQISALRKIAERLG